MVRLTAIPHRWRAENARNVRRRYITRKIQYLRGGGYVVVLVNCVKLVDSLLAEYLRYEGIV